MTKEYLKNALKISNWRMGEGVSVVIFFPDENEKEIRTLSVSNTVPDAIGISNDWDKPIIFGASKYFPYQDIALTLSPADYKKIKHNKQLLPPGFEWDNAYFVIEPDENRCWNEEKENKLLSRKEIQDKLNMKQTSCILLLKKLEEANKIKKIGQGKNIKYKKVFEN